MTRTKYSSIRRNVDRAKNCIEKYDDATALWSDIDAVMLLQYAVNDLEFLLDEAEIQSKNRLARAGLKPK